ncbi:MAG: arginine--tRNA ligase [Candidatus Omnitrophota bacterium]
MEIRIFLKKRVEEALIELFGAQSVIAAGGIILDIPKNRQFGSFSTNAAFIVSKKLGQPPLEIAGRIRETMQSALKQDAVFSEKVEKITVEAPGFINFFLSKSYLTELLRQINEEKDDFGRLKLGKGAGVHMEFVSANPTGPLNVAHGRQAAFGDSLANILEFAGYKVHREYYLNDEGVQINILGESVRARYLQALGIDARFPELGYQGKYIESLSRKVAEKYGRQFIEDNKDNRAFFSQFAQNSILDEIKEDLRAFGVEFNQWFSQKSLNETGSIDKVLAFLKEKEFVYEKEGAWWLASTRFGDDKDRVVIKSDGSWTYITPDIAYHQTKFQRGFSQMINIWGPDHHGYIPRMKAAISALGYSPESVSFLIAQLVSLASADQIIPMSTRMGQYVSLADILRAVGKDAARFFFLMRKRDSHLQFDLELAKKQSLDNPVYYIQYAYARILNILKFAQDPANTRETPQVKELVLLDTPEETMLIQTLIQFPMIVESCALNLEPHGLTVYLQELAGAFHHYYEKHRVVTDNAALTQARLFLINAVRIVLNNSLRLLSISAPEKM